MRPAIVIAAGMFIYSRPYQTCVRALAGNTSVNPQVYCAGKDAT